MKMLAPLALAALLVGCAPQREDFVDVCRAEVAERPIPPRVAAVLNEEQQAEYREGSIRICQTYRTAIARVEHQRRWAPVAAIVLGAASDALAQHNLHVYDVPQAARYHRR